jgi:hypothetical protein
MIVIPMAGLSSRFFREGYTLPKYMLEARGKTLFDHSVESFSEYFSSEHFVFIIRDVYNTKQFVAARANELGIKKYDIVVLEGETRGQAETVALGIRDFENSKASLTIFNIDTFRPHFTFPDLSRLEDGYLEVFRGSGENWSFVRPIEEDSTKIDLTTEKKPISDLCCTGLYHFKCIADYMNAFNYFVALPSEQWDKGELYVAPLYNHLINIGKEIHYNLIPREDVIFCGTPDEYNSFLEE